MDEPARADPAVLDVTVRLNNQLVTIIGIGPEQFNGEAGALVTPRVSPSLGLPAMPAAPVHNSPTVQRRA